MIALTPEDRLRLQNYSLAKIIMPIQNMGCDLPCYFHGGTVMLKDLLQETSVEAQGNWLPSSLPLLIISEGFHMELIT